MVGAEVNFMFDELSQWVGQLLTAHEQSAHDAAVGHDNAHGVRPALVPGRAEAGLDRDSVGLDGTNAPRHDR